MKRGAPIIWDIYSKFTNPPWFQFVPETRLDMILKSHMFEIAVLWRIFVFAAIPVLSSLGIAAAVIIP